MSRGLSPLERRALLGLISLIRDREPDPEEQAITEVPLSALYERCYMLKPHQSWELQRKYQRQAIRRALCRLHPEFVWAFALAWVNVEDWNVIRWQGGGSKKRSEPYPDAVCGSVTYRDCTPRWRLVGLTDGGIALAIALEREASAGGAA